MQHFFKKVPLKSIRELVPGLIRPGINSSYTFILQNSPYYGKKRTRYDVVESAIQDNLQTFNVQPHTMNKSTCLYTYQDYKQQPQDGNI